MTWNDLSMAEKAQVMKLAVEGGVYDLDAIREGYNEFAKGGRIHIKPENRGKFTALKERTGHSATWFKQHGTPAQRKMATFALNAKKWKHGDGGELDVYDKPQTFAGRIVEATGASPSMVRGADVASSIAQVTPWGHYIAATDLGRDLNRVYHEEEGAKKDVLLDLISMLPGISAPGLKVAENTWNTIRSNSRIRKALNTGIITGRVADFVDDTYGANKTSKAYGGNLYVGNNENGQQMQIGRGYWEAEAQKPTTIFTEELALFNQKREQEARERRAKLRRWTETKGKEMAEKRTKEYLTTSNDATSNAVTRPQNQHLTERAVEGAKAHAAWEKEHPVLNTVGTVLGAAPLAVAAIPAAGATIESVPALAPGSAFWMNPITQQVAASTLGGTAVDVATNMVTPYNNWAEGVADITGMPEFVAGFTNPGYMFGTQRFGWDLVPSPLVPSRGSAQMNHGRNFGEFNPDNWNNWGSESLTQLINKYAVKVPKQRRTPVDVGPKTYNDLGWKYMWGVNSKLAANKIPGFEPYEYIGYHTTKDGFVPVFRQKRLAVMEDHTSEGAKFNKEALADIEKEMATHSGLWKSWGVGDYGLGHNIGKNEEGLGRLFDATYAREPITWIMQNFPHKWEVSPIGVSRIINNQLNTKDK